MGTYIPDAIFKSSLSFLPFINHLERSLTSGLMPKDIGDRLLHDLKEHPVLSAPVVDAADIDTDDEVFERLMCLLFPPPYRERDFASLTVPLNMRSIYATPRYRAALLDADGNFHGTFRPRFESYAEEEMVDLPHGRSLTLYAMIARKFFGLDLGMSYPLVFGVTDENDLDRFYKITMDFRFADVIAKKPLEPLTEHQIYELRTRADDLDLWTSLFPPDLFEARGIALHNAIEVTDEEATSALKRELIENDALVSMQRFNRLQRYVRTLLRRPHLSLGVTVRSGDLVYMLNGMQECSEVGAELLSDAEKYHLEEVVGSVYGRCFADGAVHIVDDVAEETDESTASISAQLLAKGMRNVYTAPLKIGDQIQGVLYLSSPIPGDLNPLNTLKMGEALPLFSLALNRTIEDLNNRVQRTIREEYTAIHPSVEWRFRKAAIRLLEAERTGDDSIPEPIAFRDVYPLFNVTDIRGSSTARNDAIQQDLIDQLVEARNVVETARQTRPLAILANLTYRIDTSIASLQKGMNAGDESTVLHFIRTEIESLFDHLATFGSAVSKTVQHYRTLIDNDHGFLYRRRREFEQSVATINRVASSYVEDEEERAQSIIPHYFEKHETDGVDVGIYVGPSLLESGSFNTLYLRELRLWQLMVCVSLARRTHELVPKLPIPLETTHLILVHSQPLSIRFRMDEKQFDVDGAYNIRYEIIKKRIDKATIRETGERLTQPNMIAIVYSQDGEADEYRRYLNFLIASGHLEDGIEELDLEELQGVSGLRALRVSVNVDNTAQHEETVPEEIEAAIRAMTVEG